MDVDNIIEAEQNSSINDIFETKGEEYFRSLEQKCINELTQNTGQVISNRLNSRQNMPYTDAVWAQNHHS